MAILLIKIEDMSSLPMNEFFDYNGRCYGLSRSRTAGGNERQCINLEDFYDCTVRSDHIFDVPVIFAQQREGRFYGAGWYERAEVYRDIMRPSLFLEGNIRADSREVFLIPEEERQYEVQCHFGDKYYEVIEEDDGRYGKLVEWMGGYGGKNAFLRYDFVDIFLDSRSRRDYEACIGRCEDLARRLMADECRDIREIKALELYARQATVLKGGRADGYYYLAMACHQLGRIKMGIKAIERAARLEPEASDIMALKGNLLVSMGRLEAAAEIFRQAWLAEGDEDYLLLEGRAWMFKGQMDRAMECFKKITDKQLLLDAGINLKDMERRWPFINIRGLNIKKLFGKS